MANLNFEVSVEDDKKNILSKEYPVDEEGRSSHAKLDYSGAYEKIDPAEIKLVRKLDTWIMVSIMIASCLERDN
jgi:hypothetical protein